MRYLSRHWRKDLRNIVNISIWRCNVHLSEVIDIVIRVGRLPYKEITMEQANLVKLILVDPVIYHRLRTPLLPRLEKALTITTTVHHQDVVRDTTSEGVLLVVHVVVLPVVKLLGIELVQLVFIDASAISVVGVDREIGPKSTTPGEGEAWNQVQVK